MTGRFVTARADPETGVLKFGAWLSAPGKNVLTATGDDLLIDPEQTNLAFLSSGVVSIGVGQQIKVNFTDIGFIPLILHQLNFNGASYLPTVQNYRMNLALQVTERYSITVSRSDLDILNTTVRNNFMVRYLIAMVPQ